MKYGITVTYRGKKLYITWDIESSFLSHGDKAGLASCKPKHGSQTKIKTHAISIIVRIYGQINEAVNFFF